MNILVVDRVVHLHNGDDDDDNDHELGYHGEDDGESVEVNGEAGNVDLKGQGKMMEYPVHR